MMNKQIIIGAVLVAVVAGGAGYYLGSRTGGQNFRDFADMTAEERQARVGQFAGNGTQQGGLSGSRFGGGGVGEIVSRNDNSITVGARDGGSRIVLVPSATTVSVMTTGSLDAPPVGPQG